MIAISGVSNGTTEGVAYGTIMDEPQTVNAATTETIVREYFHDIPIMIQVAKCESTFRHRNSNGDVLTGRVNPYDVGVMQINTTYHGTRAHTMGLDLTNIYDNMAYARDLYERKGTQPWNASAPCWGRTLAANM